MADSSPNRPASHKKTIYGETLWDDCASETLKDADIKMGLFDAVGAFGLAGNGFEPGMDTNVGSNVSDGLHITANDERRSLFGLTSLKGTNVKQVGVDGVHSEVGGSYPSRVRACPKIT